MGYFVFVQEIFGALARLRLVMQLQSIAKIFVDSVCFLRLAAETSFSSWHSTPCVCSVVLRAKLPNFFNIPTI